MNDFFHKYLPIVVKDLRIIDLIEAKGIFRFLHFQRKLMAERLVEHYFHKIILLMARVDINVIITNRYCYNPALCSQAMPLHSEEVMLL